MDRRDSLGAGGARVDRLAERKPHGHAPSPARHGTTVSFTLPAAGRAELAIYDLLGRRIVTLADGVQPAGPRSIHWDGRARDGSPAWPGVYFARLVTAGQAMSARFIVTP